MKIIIMVILALGISVSLYASVNTVQNENGAQEQLKSLSKNDIKVNSSATNSTGVITVKNSRQSSVEVDGKLLEKGETARFELIGTSFCTAHTSKGKYRFMCEIPIGDRIYILSKNYEGDDLWRTKFNHGITRQPYITLDVEDRGVFAHPCDTGGSCIIHSI
ncbi:hypothetical protein LO80_05860 [Candidatus Francisella endociliophora]|uniref:Uncharacterized protein n=1 Tax=Candidatus Francisella endociliophora TaxID=653937 RepID=A0A097EPP4_9GAMM|nr:hypothetical protein [Francisella sp. FSC1006]AIT09538.1 hypothetical protein LO80_05860 [Francisella sp. FSC1006]